jgi:hypothetical protein
MAIKKLGANGQKSNIKNSKAMQHTKQEIFLRINQEVFAKGGDKLQDLTLARVINFLTQKAFWFAETVSTVSLQIQQVDTPSTAIILPFGYDMSHSTDCECILEIASNGIYYCSGSIKNLLVAMDTIQGLESLDFFKICQARLYNKGKLVMTKEMKYAEIPMPTFKSLSQKANRLTEISEIPTSSNFY